MPSAIKLLSPSGRGAGGEGGPEWLAAVPEFAIFILQFSFFNPSCSTARSTRSQYSSISSLFSNTFAPQSSARKRHQGLFGCNSRHAQGAAAPRERRLTPDTRWPG